MTRTHVQRLADCTKASVHTAKPSAAPLAPNELCEICQSIDFEALSKWDITDRRGSFVKDLEASVAELKASRCLLCQLFGSMSPADLGTDGSQRYGSCHLRAFSATLQFASPCRCGPRDPHDTNLLGVVRVKIKEARGWAQYAPERIQASVQETGFLYFARESSSQAVLNVHLLDPASVSMDFIRNCLSYCSQNHHEACRATASEPVRSLRVIDCQTRSIVNAPPKCRYVALSYVWGESSAALPSTKLQDAPKLIDDSIELTMNLGLRYLWIDRYCIDQSNQVEKHAQIRQMDLIYSRAHVTVIAAAGEDPHTGLPGISRTPRTLQPQLVVGDRTIISTLASPKWLIERSKWASRGWTYQECILSKRRLFFTDQQVFFECNGMQITESLLLPLDRLHDESKKAFRDDVPGRLAFDRAPGKNPWEVMGYIAAFNQRNLTDPADAVNAMLGLFNAFKEGPLPLRQVLGVPIVPPVADFTDVMPYKYKSSHRSAEECFLVGLSWTHQSPGRRRDCFPSWTWAGWYGKLGHSLQYSESSLVRFPSVHVSIELGDGSLMEFPAWDRLDTVLSSSHHLPRYLHIRANVMDVSIVYLHREAVLSNSDGRSLYIETNTMTQDGYWARFQIDKELSVYMEVKLDQELKSKEVIGADLEERFLPGTGLWLNESFEDAACSMLILQDKGAHAERIGLLSTSTTGCLVRHNKTWDACYLATCEKPSARQLLARVPRTRRTIRLG